jgi:hypothetical protein
MSNLPRRTFLKTSLAATATAALASRSLAASPDLHASSPRDYYEVRCYHCKDATQSALLDRYLEHAFLPALAARRYQNTGVFTELTVDKVAGTASPRADSPTWVLITHPTLESFVQVSAAINTDDAVLAAGADYLRTPKTTPAFERIDSWLLLAFKGMPRLELPNFSRDRVPTRVFEMRDYESHSELAALNKMAMFDDGEIDLMKDIGMNPVFFGQAIAGPNLPHLRYFTGAADLSTHLANWKKFGPDPRWITMRDDPRYANNMTKNTPRFLTPKSYSQI